MNTGRPVKRRRLRNQGLKIGLMLIILGQLTTSGCMFRDLRQQVSQIESACHVGGTVHGADDLPGPYVVVLARRDDDAPGTLGRVTDHFVMQRPGRWNFVVAPDEYVFLAFRDANANLRLDGNEAMDLRGGESALVCATGDRHEDVRLSVDTSGEATSALTVELDRQRAGDGAGGNPSSLGQATAFGDITRLDDPHFAPEVAMDSLWRPLNFLQSGKAGVYFLQEYDPGRIPVLFIHGINGSPRVFTEIIKTLDTDRFQPWVYYYPSGIGLDTIVGHLTNIMLELEIRHGIERFHLVAHSMGGLVARAFLLRRETRRSPAAVPRFVSLSTPWGGHSAARLGVDYAPSVVPVWYDMAPGSDFLHGIFYRGEYGSPDRQRLRLPDTEMHMLFTYRRTEYLSQDSNDGVIALFSLLRPEAQDEAEEVYGYDDTHVGILDNEAAIDHVHRLLLNSQ